MLRLEMEQVSRAQLVDEGPVNRVYLEQPALGRRMTVLWNCSGQPRDASIKAIGPKAQLMDRFGAVSALDVGADGSIRVSLAAATANTIEGFPDAYFIGGAPALVLEPLPDDYTPFAPTYANLPDPGQP